MKDTGKFLLLLLFINCQISNAQVGIGTINPDASSILDLTSNSQGVLTPRMTTEQRNLILNPAIGLLIYNTTTSNFNYYDVGWKDYGTYAKCYSTTGVSDIGTKSNIDATLPDMSISPIPGKYSLSFDSQLTNNIMIIAVNTDTLLADFFLAYNQLETLPTTNSSHINFGNETISPGKYSVASAIEISGTLTLDAGGNPNALFVFKANGDLNMAVGTTIILKNGAHPENVFWVAEGAIGIGANTIAKGILISHSYAIAIGNASTLDGKMLTNSGAIAFGTGTCTTPSKESSIISLGSLSTFVAFTGSGAINNTGNSVYNGNIASGLGATSSLAAATVNGTLFPPGSTAAANSGYSNENTIATFSIYQGGILIPNSVRKFKCNSNRSNLSLQTIVDVVSGQTIDVMWNISSGTLAIGNRILTLMSVK
ncbi:ice-binding family protein [Flavobacterium sp. LB3P21]|uniref:ice-binding family protein n=1 Tax=Flavobacterium sp. LB3P21 TaxID=3401719 RepID=UPI003AAF9094